MAAESILARNEFVTRLANIGKSVGVALPKGTGAQVDQVAKELVGQHGSEVLTRSAKIHFRTALRAQGLPEPPRQEWKKR